MRWPLRRRPKAPEVAEAEQVRDAQFAAADEVMASVLRSVQMLDAYTRAEKRRVAKKGWTS